MTERAASKSSGALVVCMVVDVCKAPKGGVMVPTAYRIAAKFDTAEDTAEDVLFGSLPAFTMTSLLPRVKGDERGIGGGIFSGCNMGSCRPIENDSTVYVHSRPVLRNGDLMLMNCNDRDGKANTIGRIVYVGEDMPDIDDWVGEDDAAMLFEQDGVIKISKREYVKDPKTGRVVQDRTTTTTIDQQNGTIRTDQVTRELEPNGMTSVTMNSRGFDTRTGGFAYGNWPTEQLPFGDARGLAPATMTDGPSLLPVQFGTEKPELSPDLPLPENPSPPPAVTPPPPAASPTPPVATPPPPAAPPAAPSSPSANTGTAPVSSTSAPGGEWWKPSSYDWGVFAKEFGVGLGEAALEFLTVGGYGGLKRGIQEGRVNAADQWSGVKALAEGVFNTITLGAGEAAVNAYADGKNVGGVVGAGLKGAAESVLPIPEYRTLMDPRASGWDKATAAASGTAKVAMLGAMALGLKKVKTGESPIEEPPKGGSEPQPGSSPPSPGSGTTVPRTPRVSLTDPSIPDWKLGAFKSEAKWASQMAKRGWTSEQIGEAIRNGQAFPAENLVNSGNLATRYVHPETLRSVVVDNVTNEVIHVGGDGFKY